MSVFGDNYLVRTFNILHEIQVFQWGLSQKMQRNAVVKNRSLQIIQISDQ